MWLHVTYIALHASVLCAVSATTVVCNYCFDADVIDDCHLNVRHCPPEHVCFIDVKHIEYKSPTDGRVKAMTRYKMGCLFASLCTDTVRTEPGLYGLATVFRSCCCTDRCDVPDGVGRGNWSACPDHLAASVLNGAVETWPAITDALVVNAVICIFTYSISL
ncbi:hypothetical protein LSAT2_030286 [Lamellibrachia satsuma]|nr:hypothetical protein LSAT2_030286 [Lamellibrachia satsuma]